LMRKPRRGHLDELLVRLLGITPIDEACHITQNGQHLESLA